MCEKAIQISQRDQLKVFYFSRSGFPQRQITGGEHVLSTVISRKRGEDLWGGNRLQLPDQLHIERSAEVNRDDCGNKVRDELSPD